MNKFGYIRNYSYVSTVRLRDMKKLITQKDGSLRYNNVRIDNIPTPNWPEMVTITKGPWYVGGLFNKKYITLEKAILAIDEVQGNNMITQQYIDPSCVIWD